MSLFHSSEIFTAVLVEMLLGKLQSVECISLLLRD